MSFGMRGLLVKLSCVSSVLTSLPSSFLLSHPPTSSRVLTYLFFLPHVVCVLFLVSRVLSHASDSQWHLFDAYAGIRPMSAASAHAGSLDAVFAQVLSKASLVGGDIDAIAVTAGPGLAPCLEVGLDWSVRLAKQLAVPLVGVHHMQAHAMVAQMDHPHLAYPFLALLVSGGHTELWLVRSQNHVSILAQTADDAVGEAFDKVARTLGLTRLHNESPGAAVERLAATAPPSTASTTTPMFSPLQHDNADFSFAGIKSAMMREVLQRRVDRLPADSPLLQDEPAAGDRPSTPPSSSVPRLLRNPDGRINNATISLLVKEMRAQQGLSKQAALDPSHTAHTLLAQLPELDHQEQVLLCAAFQRAVCEQLTSRALLALRYCSRLPHLPPVTQLVVGGGVACNMAIQSALRRTLAPLGVDVVVPRKLHCMDNGIMIAWMGSKLLQQGHADSLDLRFHPKWPIGDKIDTHQADIRAREAEAAAKNNKATMELRG